MPPYSSARRDEAGSVSGLRRARAAVLPVLTRIAARVAGSGPVIVPEYDLHPQARYGWEGNAPLPALARSPGPLDGRPSRGSHCSTRPPR